MKKVRCRRWHLRRLTYGPIIIFGDSNFKKFYKRIHYSGAFLLAELSSLTCGGCYRKRHPFPKADFIALGINHCPGGDDVAFLDLLYDALLAMPIRFPNMPIFHLEIPLRVRKFADYHLNCLIQPRVQQMPHPNRRETIRGIDYSPRERQRLKDYLVDKFSFQAYQAFSSTSECR